MIRSPLIALASLFLSACVSLPEGVSPVKSFDIDRYLGTWYEIARLDHSFERGLSKVSATYSLHDEGGIKVINRGYSMEKQQWKQAEGRAYFVDNEDVGHLKVSFFGPFYSSYVVFELDHENYQYAFVSGYNRSYLWLLARTPRVSEEIKQKFIDRSAELGFRTHELIFVEQSRP